MHLLLLILKFLPFVHFLLRNLRTSIEVLVRQIEVRVRPSLLPSPLLLVSLLLLVCLSPSSMHLLLSSSCGRLVVLQHQQLVLEILIFPNYVTSCQILELWVVDLQASFKQLGTPIKEAGPPPSCPETVYSFSFETSLHVLINIR